jgi:uncharacterized membrane protein
MSICACLSFLLIFTIQFNNLLPDWSIPFINPIGLSLVGTLVYERKFKRAVLAYFIGIVFSLFPLMVNIIPLLFIHLFLMEYHVQLKTKSQQFLSRVYVNYIIGIGFFALQWSIQKPESRVVAFDIHSFYLSILIEILYIVIGYWLLIHMLNAYYERRNWKFVFALIPILTAIPLLCIPFEKGRTSNLHEHERNP